MKKILISTVVIACCFVVTLATSRADDPKVALQGVWEAKSAEREGKQAPPEVVKTLRFTFKGDKVSVEDGKKAAEDATYTLDAKKSPKQIDLIPANLPAEMKNRKILGIYELKGDELKFCFRRADVADTSRPTEFATKEGSGLMFVVFKKAPADKK